MPNFGEPFGSGREPDGRSLQFGLARFRRPQGGGVAILEFRFDGAEVDIGSAGRRGKERLESGAMLEGRLGVGFGVAWSFGGLRRL